MPADDFDPDADELIHVANENPDIAPGTATRKALETPGGMADKGWYEIDPGEAKEAELRGLKKDELSEQAEAAGIDTTGMTKDDIRAALVNAAENT